MLVKRYRQSIFKRAGSLNRQISSNQPFNPELFVFERGCLIWLFSPDGDIVPLCTKELPALIKLHASQMAHSTVLNRQINLSEYPVSSF